MSSSTLTIDYADAATAEHVKRSLDSDPESSGLAVSRTGKRIRIEAGNALMDAVMSLAGALAASIVALIEKLGEQAGRPAVEKNTA